MSQPANAAINLDIRCAELGRNFAEIDRMDEKVLNDVLAVLEEQGPYAMFLYLKARHSDLSSQVERHCLGLLHEVFSNRIQTTMGASTNVMKAVEKLAESLDDLLFVRDLLRNALGYARYYVKAKGDRT